MTLHGYDFADYQVRQMVVENHIPYEIGLITYQGTTLLPVVCERCQVEWPCPQRSALREWEAGASRPVDTEITEAAG